jgi:hypothetical protein
MKKFEFFTVTDINVNEIWFMVTHDFVNGHSMGEQSRQNFVNINIM